MQTSEPVENNLSTGADEGTVAFSFRKRYFTDGNWQSVSKDSEHGSSRKRKHSVVTLFTAVTWHVPGWSSKSKKSSLAG